MAKRQTTEEFIIKANEKHKNRYDYSLTNVIKSNIKIVIICKEHGEFLQTPNSHLNGNGCPKCGKILGIKKKELTNKDFLLQVNNKFPDRDWEVISEYISHRDQVLIDTKYGTVSVKANNLLQGKSPTIMSALNKTDYFINQAKIVSTKYLYNKVKYIDSHTHVIITCPIHGDFNISPGNFLQGKGCNKCAIEYRGLNRRLGTDMFIEKANKVHTSRYDYSKVEYTTHDCKVTINCALHGDFLQKANSHLNGSGCPKCSKMNTVGFTRTDFIKCSINRNPVLYIIKCEDNEEEFYKIGITSTNVQNRFQTDKKLPYKYKILYTYECTADCVWDKEKELHKKYRVYKYLPLKIFSGYTECFNIELPIEGIIGELEN